MSAWIVSLVIIGGTLALLAINLLLETLQGLFTSRKG